MMQTIRVGLLAAGLGIMAAPFVSGAAFVAVAILAGCGVGTVWTNTGTLISGLAAEAKMGATMGAAGSFKEFGDMAGPLMIGAISQGFGLKTGFVACAILGLLSLLLIRGHMGITPKDVSGDHGSQRGGDGPA